MRGASRIRLAGLALALIAGSLLLAGCGQSDKERAMKAGPAGPGEQLRERVLEQADR